MVDICRKHRLVHAPSLVGDGQPSVCQYDPTPLAAFEAEGIEPAAAIDMMKGKGALYDQKTLSSVGSMLGARLSQSAGEGAKKLGVDPGGAIMIHGLPKEWAWIGAGHRSTDWTLGCIAVTNPEIEEIWSLVPLGTPVEIRP